MRINSKGQVTIPADIRARAGLVPNTEVAVAYDGTDVRIVPVARKPASGAALVAHLRGRGDVKMSTDAIMALMRGG